MKCQYIIYDSECMFCNKHIMFIAQNDNKNCFKFTSSLSNFGIKLLSKYNLNGMEKSTIILLSKDEIYTKSIAIRKILFQVPSYKIISYLMYLFPKKFSDYVYDLASKNRKLIIKNNICEIPNSKIRKKFIL